jgi:hypothetical protein
MACPHPLTVTKRIRAHDVRSIPASDRPGPRPSDAVDVDVPSYQGSPLWSPARNEAKGVLLPAAFPDGLSTVNAVTFGPCSLWPGDRARVGRVTPEVYAELGPVELTRFLIVTDIVRTFLHVEAELCLSGSREGKGDVVRVTGRHHYCGNECTDDEVRFSLHVDEGGLISVTSDETAARPKDLQSLRAQAHCPDYGK